MRLIGILNWYDERPGWLIACVTSMIVAGIDHLVAVDGAYALYPGGTPASSQDQHEAILAVCRGAGIGCTLHIPTEVYPGNEIEKRSLAFRFAEPLTSESDWYFLMDADQIVSESFGLREALEQTELDVGTVRFHEAGTTPYSGFPVRCVFRALRGLHLSGSHCNYVLPDGRRLWANGPDTGSRNPIEEPAVDLSPFVIVEHKTSGRTAERMLGRDGYYERRNRLGAETVNA